MIKCVPVITTNSYGTPKIAFDVTLVEVEANIDNIHTTYGGGAGFQGKEIGRASVVLEHGNTIRTRKELKVIYLSGYRKDGKDFCVETEKSIVEACKTAARTFWWG